MDDIFARLDGLDWARIGEDLDETGGARTGPIFSAQECADLAALWDAATFRSEINMRRHGFGSGIYRYFDAPMPDPVANLREAAYGHLALIANRWATCLGNSPDLPETLEQMLDRCHRAGQIRPTPLMLRYQTGDYNCLHQDIYGDVAFPLQMVVQLSDPAKDFDGGEFVLVEQRPRMQSRPTVLSPRQGEAVIFATSRKPRRGAKRWTASILRHGVSRVERGERLTLGVIFHDAK